MFLQKVFDGCPNLRKSCEEGLRVEIVKVVGKDVQDDLGYGIAFPVPLTFCPGPVGMAFQNVGIKSRILPRERDDPTGPKASIKTEMSRS